MNALIKIILTLAGDFGEVIDGAVFEIQKSRVEVGTSLIRSSVSSDDARELIRSAMLSVMLSVMVSSVAWDQP